MSFVDLPKDVLRIIVFRSCDKGRWATLAIFRAVCKKFARCISLDDLNQASIHDVRHVPVGCIHFTKFVDKTVNRFGFTTHTTEQEIQHVLHFLLVFRTEWRNDAQRFITTCLDVVDIDTKYAIRALYQPVKVKRNWTFVNVAKDPRYVRNCIVAMLCEMIFLGLKDWFYDIDESLQQSYCVYARHVMEQNHRKMKRLKRG